MKEAACLSKNCIFRTMNENVPLPWRFKRRLITARSGGSLPFHSDRAVLFSEETQQGQFFVLSQMIIFNKI